MSRVKRASVVATIATVVAVAALGVGIASNVRVSKQETTKELGVSAFSIGLLDDDTGKLPTGEDAVVDKSGISTDKYYKLDGLQIEMDKNATVEYCVNYYAEDKSFLGVQKWDTDFDSSAVISAGASAKYVKIEIIPTEDDDETVSLFEIAGYVSQLTITVVK